MKMCYEKKFCEYCKKENCDKRLQAYYLSNESKYDKCNGDCYECQDAVRPEKLIGVTSLEYRFSVLHCCFMYQTVKHGDTCFYGREGIESEDSKIELALKQLKKCRQCERIEYQRILNEINERIKKIPQCFRSMTELSSNHILESLDESIVIALQEGHSCKVKTVLVRMIQEYMQIHDKEENIDLKELCHYLLSKEDKVDYYIHPLTINSLIN